MFAGEYGCIATGIDITREYIRTATALSALTGLSDNTRFVNGSALQLPFENNSFDVVWTQHVQMNIEDKQTFYAEIQRVLTPGGQFIYYDIFSNAHKPIHFPVPWAEVPDLSFLITLPEFTNLLTNAGLQQTSKTNQTASGIQFFETLFEKAKTQGMPKVGLQLLIGEPAPERLRNVYRNLTEENIVLESGICIKN
jgi:ubiquinone/menaquinone biosynthesis C-methylase UbiE